MADPLLSIRDLRVEFETFEGTAKVLNGIDFDLEPGETVAIVGETGCGKSVTAKSILGVLPPTADTQGEIEFDGTDLTTLSEEELHRLRGSSICMIMQDPMTSINPVFTIGEQMMDVLRYQGRPHISIFEWLRNKFKDDSELKERALEMLETTKIPAPENVFDRYPHELSGGMRQRVLISIALLSEPRLMIADEPGTALDVTTEQNILELLKDLTDELDTSMLYITHDLSVANHVSEKIIVMYAGDVVEAGPTEQVLAEPRHPYTRGLVDSLPTISKPMGDGIEGGIPSYVDPPTACRFAERCAYAAPECREFYPYPRDIGADQSVACHLYHGSPSLERHHELARTNSIDIGSPPWQSDQEPEAKRGESGS